MKFSKPGDLIQASRNPKMKRHVMKAIGMPMRKKRKAMPMMTRTMQTKPTLGNSRPAPSAPNPNMSGGRAFGTPAPMSGIANSTPMFAGPKKSAIRKKHKASGPIKISGKFQGKSNALGQGGRAAQLESRGVPGGVIGNLARAAQAAPGQKNFHKKKIAKKGSSSLVKAPMSRYVRKTAKKGTMGLVKSPKANRMQTMRRKVAKKGTSGTSFGDKTLQNTKMEHREENSKGFKRSKKG